MIDSVKELENCSPDLKFIIVSLGLIDMGKFNRYKRHINSLY